VNSLFFFDLLGSDTASCAAIRPWGSGAVVAVAGRCAGVWAAFVGATVPHNAAMNARVPRGGNSHLDDPNRSKEVHNEVERVC